MDLTYKEILGIITIILSLVGYYTYLKSILAKKTQPHIYSWLVWSIVLSITFLGQISDNAGPGAWTIGFGALLSIIITILSLKYGTKDITKSDKIMLFFSIIAIILFLNVDNVLYAILLASLIDSASYVPTMRKTIKAPFSEDLGIYHITNIKTILSIFALNNFSMITSFYPITLLVINTIFIIITLYYRKKLKLGKLKNI